MKKSNNTKKKNNTKEKEHYQIKRKQIQKNNHLERITGVTVDLESRESGLPKMAFTAGPSFPRDVSSSTFTLLSGGSGVTCLSPTVCVGISDRRGAGMVHQWIENTSRAPPPDPHRPANKTRLRSSDQSKRAPADFPSSSSSRFSCCPNS